MNIAKQDEGMNNGDLEMALLHHAICLVKDKEIET